MIFMTFKNNRKCNSGLFSSFQFRMQAELRRPIVTTNYQVSFDDALVSAWMLKDLAGNGFHLNIVGTLGMFALANVVPRDQVDGQIPGAIREGPEGEDEDGDEPGEPPPKARKHGP